MNETSSKNEITSGIIWKQLLLFFFPILLGSFFQQLYNTIDAVIVGRFVGKNALAAVAGSSGMVINLLVNFFTGLTAGASVIVSQFFLVLLDAFGNNVGGPFAIFGVFSALSIPFVMRLVPETNGKSLEEIEEEMTKR